MSRTPFAEPHAEVASNPGRDDYWTCPGCYTDLGGIGRGEHVCPACDRAIVCSVEYEPVCVTKLATLEEAQ